MRRSAALVCWVVLVTAACSVPPTMTPVPTASPIAQPSATLTAVIETAELIDEPTPTPRPTLTPLPSDPNCVHGVTHVRTSDEVYSGACWGWRIGPENFDTGDVWKQDLQLNCDVKLYGDSIETSGPPWDQQPSDLDISMDDVPDGATFEHIDKWTCGTRGISDHALLTLEIPADSEPVQVDIARWLDASGWLVIETLPGGVRSCRIERLPAICLEHVPYGAYAETPAVVFVLEDSTLDPRGRVLRLWSDQASLEELIDDAGRVVRG